MSIDELLHYLKAEKVKYVDIRFVDILGVWHHITVPTHILDRDLLENGIGFDGSSIKLWQEIYESDMLLKPDPSTVKIDPFMEPKTAVLISEVYDPLTGEPYPLDPRYVAKKVYEYLRKTGVADEAYFGPEVEFFIFDKVRYKLNSREALYEIDSIEAIWNTEREEGLGYQIRHKEGYLPVPPWDTLHNIRAEACEILESLDIPVEAFHHEVATGGQGEIDLKYDTLINMADKIMWYKYVLRNVAKKYGKTVTFMPKPMTGDNGSGMHVHMSLWKDGKNIFAGNKYGGLSETALHYIGGILENANKILAFTNPTINSFKRLVPGYEAPTYLIYAQRNRSAAIRVPMYSTTPSSKRIEARFPDPSSNPYLALSALLIAGLDGIKKKIHPGDPMEKNIYSLSERERKNLPQLLPGLEEALKSLSDNRALLTSTGAFSDTLIDKFVSYKLEKEVELYKTTVTPTEFFLYFDV